MVGMNEWKCMNKWVITDVETDESIIIYNGSFLDVMDFVNGRYEDGTIYVISYENYIAITNEVIALENFERESYLWED